MLDLYSFPFSAMGTECNLHFYSTNSSKAQEVSQAAISEVNRIEARYSRYNTDSLLSEINRVAQTGGSITLDEETGGLLDYAYACHEHSGGLFDISCGILRQAWDFSSNTLPKKETMENLLARIGLDKISWDPPNLRFSVPGMELDLGGIGKEYASDRVAEICVSMGIQHGLVDLGGDINVFGPHPDQEPWIIGIRDPKQTGSILGEVQIFQGSLASSGDYERCMVIDGKRYSHIISPITGWPVSGLASVSVVSDKCIVAGSICTIAMLKGIDGIEWLKEIDARHSWIDENGRQGGSAGFWSRPKAPGLNPGKPEQEGL
ncbi:MAG: FAD:protein FMN transferase [Nitrospinae bacterium]|nr:FAD:protein FMN transferase [Nitrospinota bacterium]